LAKLVAPLQRHILPVQWRHQLGERLASDGVPPALQAAPRHLRAFYERYRAWSGQLLAAADGGYRICFRLEPPDSGEEPADGPTTAGIWTLRFFLQAADDPSLLVPAETVWREAGDVLHYLGRRFDEPQERLLGGLGRASRIFPPLEKSLQGPRPAACPLTTEEAYAFLREYAPLLEGAGFRLLVPPWWGQRGARLGLQLHIAPVLATGGNPQLGLDELVRYDWRLSLGGESLSQEEFERLADLKVPLVRVRGQWVELRTDQVEAALRFWRERGQREQDTLREALRLAQMAGEGSLDRLPLTEVSGEGWVDEVLQRLSGRETLAPVPQPASFRGQLRPYQANGVSWLAFLHRWGLGACLADDMGLGKTVQVLALLLYAREQGLLRGPWLLVCPTSAVGNWQREAARFAPDLSVAVHHGVERARGDEFAAEVARHDLVLSTYSLLHRDEETLARVDWEGVVLDEAQNIKNPGTLQAQAARRLRARHRLALTGTPVENRLAELWSIMEFLNPGYLGSQADFRRRLALPIERYQDPGALRQLRSLVRPFLLRRVKSDPLVIQDLPERVEIPVYCRLTQEQATLYQAAVDDAMQQIAESAGIQRRGLVLAMLMKLKQICNHPAQFLHDGSELAGRSGKLARLTEMLEEAIAEGDRALVFTQFAEMGEMLRRHLQAELHAETLLLHGGTPQPERERMIQRFQEDPHGPPVFVLSLKAGGTALNLMRANHVFHFDRWWNPAVENQATDRAHRIGQGRRVLVHKFICLGTLEERIADLIEGKKALAENVVESGEGWLTELSTEELRELLVLQKDAVEV
ncbi:MAG: DEAD/DEAH box helicase, partial [Anaerolineae bacterium]|nr:DEAD/DEAH box helicase [Anaerolineae bacterium]